MGNFTITAQSAKVLVSALEITESAIAQTVASITMLAVIVVVAARETEAMESIPTERNVALCKRLLSFGRYIYEVYCHYIHSVFVFTVTILSSLSKFTTYLTIFC